MNTEGSLSKSGLLHLSVVYVIWGSTYLGIRVAVREGSGFPPFAMAALRVFAASGLLFAWAALAKHRLRIDRGELVLLSVTGLLLWTVANGLVTWAEQRTDSGLAALIVATMPLWAALMNGAWDRRAPTPRLIASLLIGFGGVALLTAPVLKQGNSADLAAVIGLLIAPMSWALGSLMMQHRRPQLTVQVSSAYQQLFGGVGFLVATFLLKEPRPAPIGEAWLAWGYLVLFGSVVAFTSFIKALRSLPVNVTMTYAYVNPVIAVLLGWLILGESITWWTAAGTVLVVTGVSGVFRAPEARARS